MNQPRTIPDGQRTRIIYSLIKDGKYQDVNFILSRLSIISIMNYSFVQEADLCLYLHIAIL